MRKRAPLVTLIGSLHFVLVAATLSQRAPASDQPARFDLRHSSGIVRLVNPEVSPDGRTIAVVVTRTNLDANRYDSELVLVDVATGAQRTVTRDRHALSLPKWSPTGSHLAFLARTATADRGEQNQVFVLPMLGGDSYTVTTAPGGVHQYAWRPPDGRQIAYVTPDEPAPTAGYERFNKAFLVGQDPFAIRKEPRPYHIWLATVAGGEAYRLTQGDWSIPFSEPPAPPPPPLAWSPDGVTLAFVRAASPHSADTREAAVYRLDLTTGDIRPLHGQGRFEREPNIGGGASPQVAFLRRRDGDPLNVNELVVVPIDGGPARRFDLDRNLTRSVWLPDGRVLVGGNARTQVGLWVQPLDGSARRLELGDVSPVSSFGVDVGVGRDGSIAFVGTTSRRPFELYYLPSTESIPRRLTDFNRAIAALELASTATLEWDVAGGLRANGTLTFPPGFERARGYPVIVLLHGGPQTASLETFSSLAQLMAARNWIVFQPNYRGSDNLGNAYQRAIFRDPALGPGRDVLDGLTALKAQPFVDATRIAVGGWSYGGYLTSWLISRSGGWRAAVAGAPIVDLVDQQALADGYGAMRYLFGGTPWADGLTQAYRLASPIDHVAAIRTPTLIMATTDDYRVPAHQAFKLFRALQERRVPAQLVAYPVHGHVPSDPVHTLDYFRRWIDWLDQHLR